MKNLIWVSFLTAFCFLCSNTLNAQVYESALGVRLGYPTTISYKHFISTNAALEGNLGLRRFSDSRWTNISGAYLLHFPISKDLPDLQWYAGGGATVVFWSYNDGFLGGTPRTSTGIQGYLGLDYTFENVPVNITLDWVPFFFFTGTRGFNADFGGIAIRYVLK